MPCRKLLTIFPPGFCGGAATASHQVEGNNKNNNWSAWEEQPGKIIQGQHSGLACDWWSGRRWKEDFDRAAETGQNAQSPIHRMEPRIPTYPGTPWDENALDYYREIVRGLVETENDSHGYTCTIFPTHSGWLKKEVGKTMKRPGFSLLTYVKSLGALKEYTNLWVTINEPNVYVL